MKENKYRSIMKGTTLFGGVQVFQILMNILRGKIVALYLGPEGMGISGLFVSSLTIIISLAGMGFSISSVRYLSQIEDDEKKQEELNTTRFVFFITGLIGLVLTCISSPLLSKSSFQSFSYTSSYLILSIYVFFTLIDNGFISICQACGKLKIIANASLIPSIFSLGITFFVYKFLGKDGIVLVLLVGPILTFLYYEFSLSKVLGRIKRTSLGKVVFLFKKYFGLGFLLILGSLLGTVITYINNFIISHIGSISDVGLYNAGTSITNQYIGMLFSAMSVDYFPKLSALVNKDDEFNEFVNQQSTIINLLAFPLISIMIVTAPILIKILLTDDFLSIQSFIAILAFGMLLKAFSYPFGYISFAMNSKKIYFVLEIVIANIQSVFLLFLGYYFFKLNGLAIGFAVSYVLYFFEVIFICKKVFKIVISKKNVVFFSISFITTLGLCLLSLKKSTVSWIVSVLIVILVSVFSLCELEKCINLREILSNKFKLKKEKNRG